MTIDIQIEYQSHSMNSNNALIEYNMYVIDEMMRFPEKSKKKITKIP